MLHALPLTVVVADGDDAASAARAGRSSVAIVLAADRAAARVSAAASRCRRAVVPCAAPQAGSSREAFRCGAVVSRGTDEPGRRARRSPSTRAPV